MIFAFLFFWNAIMICSYALLRSLVIGKSALSFPGLPPLHGPIILSLDTILIFVRVRYLGFEFRTLLQKG